MASINNNVYNSGKKTLLNESHLKRVNTDSSGSKTRTEGKPSAGRLEKMPPNIHTNKRK